MNSYNFADIYRSAHFSLEPANMALRQKSADRFLSERNVEDCLGLVRLHLGLSAPAFRDRLVKVFHDDDGTFSIVGTDRELVILSTGLLASIVKSGDIQTALSLVTASFAGRRAASICPELAEWAKAQLLDAAVHNRRSALAAGARISKFEKSKVPAQVDAWLPAPDFPKLAPILKQISQDTEAYTAAVSDSANKALEAVISEFHELREELEILWWNVGGYSTQLNMPFSEIPTKLVPLLSGIELAGLTRSTAGPAAVGALIQLKLKACNVPAVSTIADAVDSAAREDVAVPSVPDSHALSDLCPLLMAITLRRTTGDGPAWHGAFKQRAGVEASAQLPTLDLAMQIFRELRLIGALTE
jgi:hypothetical protein